MAKVFPITNTDLVIKTSSCFRVISLPNCTCFNADIDYRKFPDKKQQINSKQRKAIIMCTSMDQKNVLSSFRGQN